MEKILRLPAVIERIGKTRSPLYADIQAGLFVKPIKLGARAAGWPESEVTRLVAARIAGASNESLRKLVVGLHAARCLEGDGHSPYPAHRTDGRRLGT
jgi:prophage regulatory protein